MNSLNPTGSRREFLKTGASAGVTSALVGPSLLAASSARGQEATPRKLGVALVGLGGLSTNQIAPALQKTKNCKLVAIVTGTPAKAEKWKAQYQLPEKNIYNYQTMGRMADNAEIDLVYVVTPNGLHPEHVIKAAEAGKHVLCEKPMANSVREAEQMIQACRSAKRLLAIAYRCQFEPHHQECMRLAREKVFGELKMIEAGFGFQIGDPNQWRLKKALAGGGALMDVGVYALQACRYLAREEPTEVSALESKTDREKFKEVDETITWQMSFPSGVLAYCSTTYRFNGINRFTAYAEKGWFGLDPAYSYSGIQGKTSKEPISFPQLDHFAAELDDFAACIAANKPSRVSGEEGLKDLKVVEAIYRSIVSGKKEKI